MSKTTAPNVDSVLNKIRAELRRQASAANIQLAATLDRAALECRGDPGISTAKEWQEHLEIANALASQVDANQYMRQRMHWTAPGFGEANFNPGTRDGTDLLAVALWRLSKYWILECNLGTLRSVLHAARATVDPIRALNRAVREAGAPKVVSLLAQRIRSEDPERGAGLVVEGLTAALEAVQEVERTFSQFLVDGSPWDDLPGATNIAADSGTPFWMRPAPIRQAQAVIRTRELLLSTTFDDRTIAQLTDDGASGSIRDIAKRVNALRRYRKKHS